MLQKYTKYKNRLLVFEAALQSPDLTKVLMVKSCYTTTNAWQFPKGKIEVGELPIACAIREVFEETGFNCFYLIDENNFIECVNEDKKFTRLYLVKNVSMEYHFSPNVQHKIEEIKWFSIDQLPSYQCQPSVDYKNINFKWSVPLKSKLKSRLKKNKKISKIF